MQDALHVIFTAIVLSVVTYALPSFAGQLSQSDKARINSLFRKAFKRRLCNTQLNIDDLIDTAVQSADTIDSRLCHQMLWDKQYIALLSAYTHYFHQNEMPSAYSNSLRKRDQ